MARIMLVAPSFSGHLHPTLGAARVLSREHDVVVVADGKARARIEAAGVPMRILLNGRAKEIDKIANPGYATEGNPILMERLVRANIRLMADFQSEFREACLDWKPDLVIAESIIPVAGSVARSLGIAWWTLLTSQPSVYENATAPPCYFHGLTPMPGVFGRLRDAAGWGLIKAFKRGLFLRYRNEVTKLGFPRAYNDDGSESVYSPDRVLMTSVRELEFATSWPVQVDFIGPIYYTPHVRKPEPTPPRDPSRKRVFVSFGTHNPWARAQRFAEIRKVARDLPYVDIRCSLANPAEADHRHAEANLTILPYADYKTECAESDLVIHHAGSGIANAAMAQGVPSLVLPVDYDQYDAAARFCAANVSRRLRSVRDLVPAIESALNDTELRDGAARYRDIFASYDAKATIAKLVRDRFPVEQLVGGGPL